MDKIVEKVLKIIEEEELKGDHEMTYLLWDSLDMLTKEIQENERENLIANYNKRIGYFISKGIKEGRKDTIIKIGLVIGVGCIGYFGYRYYVTYKSKKNKEEIEA